MQKENLEFKKILKTLCSKLDGINSKIAEFEIVFDAAEIIEEEREEAEKYNTEWNPYDDEDFEPESYEQYYNDDEDEDELPRGY